ncbi:MAG: PspA/IM30 family protein [Polyangiaceae bacterium]|nr:PspA/IM30 family protein [Polyangiaceae bacterium]
MTIAGRFFNFVRGLFWQGQRALEQGNPEAVYEMAIRKMKTQYQHMHGAVGRLAAERNRLRNLIALKEKSLAQIEGDLEAALGEAQGGNADAMELGEDLLNEKEALEGELKALAQELAASEKLVADYLAKLRELEAKTKGMESKKDAMIAKLQSAQARKSFNEMMSGMSTSAEESAVADIDKHIESVTAQADITDEMSGATREEKRRQLRQAAQSRAAKSRFQAMLEARQAGAAGGAQATTRVTEGKSGIG